MTARLTTVDVCTRALVVRPRRLAVHASAKSEHHCSPAAIHVPVRVLAGGRIGLDPCSNARSEVDAAVEWTRIDNGLARTWLDYGLVYVNPPYGRVIGRWTAKCAETGEAGEEVVGLLPARTDTAWFQVDVLQRATAVLFWRGRLVFVGSTQGAPFPSILVFWGPRRFALRAAATFEGKGRFLWLK